MKKLTMTTTIALFLSSNLVYGSCSGGFVDSGQSLGHFPSLDVSLGDLDGDNDLDAVEANINKSKIWINNGSGTFTDNGQSFGNSASYSHGISLGDLDGDNDLDIFVANSYGQSNRVRINNGNGIFTDSGQSLGNSHSLGVALGDLDGDKDLDAFVANGTKNKVWINDGNGIFTDSGQSLGNSASFDVSLGDLDGDNDLDAFVVNFNKQPNKVYINNGNGIFTDSGQSLGNLSSRDVALGDLDGDNDLDAFVVNFHDQPNKVYINNGNGIFTDSGQSLGNASSHGIALGDLDGDDDLDAFVANYSLHPDEVWINNNGTFTDSGQSLAVTRDTNVSLGDLDGDNDLDAFLANLGGNKVLLNEIICNYECDYIYGVHDNGLNNSQLVRYKAGSGIEPLGELLSNYDIEALDISPDGKLYGAAGDDTDKKGYLYTFDMETGTILSENPTGCNELDGISFKPSDGSLWGWDQYQGLVQIIDGSCSLVLVNINGLEIEDLSWNNAGDVLFFAYNNHHGANPDRRNDTNSTYHIGKYSDGLVDWNVCDIQAPEIEALEVIDNDTLLIGYHDNAHQLTKLISLQDCHNTTVGEVTPYNDIEGLAVCLL